MLDEFNNLTKYGSYIVNSEKTDGNGTHWLFIINLNIFYILIFMEFIHQQKLLIMLNQKIYTIQILLFKNRCLFYAGGFVSKIYTLSKIIKLNLLKIGLIITLSYFIIMKQ